MVWKIKANKTVSLKVFIFSIILALIIGLFGSYFFLGMYFTKAHFMLGIMEMNNDANMDLYTLSCLNEGEIENTRKALEKYIAINISTAISYDYSFVEMDAKKDIEEIILKAKLQFKDSLDVPTYKDEIIDLNRIWKGL